MKKKGFVRENATAVVTLVIGIGVAALVMIFVGALGGQVYQASSHRLCDLNTGGKGEVGCSEGINDENISLIAKNAITSSFQALETTGDYLPIIVLAVIISIVLALVVNIGGGNRSYYGGAL